MWQDIVISIASVLLCMALVPQIIKGFKEKREEISILTASITTLGMYIVAFTYFTLNLPVSTIVAIVTGSLWLVLFIQSVIYKK
jgi:uncharacterized protein with PQ loop repeat